MAKEKIDENTMEVGSLSVFTEIYDIERNPYAGGKVEELGVSVIVTHKGTGQSYEHNDTVKKSNLSENYGDLGTAKRILRKVLRRDHVQRSTFIVRTVKKAIDKALESLERQNKIRDDLEVGVETIKELEEKDAL